MVNNSCFSIILVESALERIDSIAINNSNRRFLKKIRRNQAKFREKTILDVSIHNHLMQHLMDRNKRGRPDIIQNALLMALGSRLNKEGYLQVYVHTRNDEIITFDPQVRIPRNYNRFIGLMEQLFEVKTISTDSQQTLISITSQTLEKLLHSIQPTLTVLFTENGTLRNRTSLLKSFSDQGHIAILIGGFPHGDFSPRSLALSDLKVSIYPQPLDTLVVICSILNIAEQLVGINE